MTSKKPPKTCAKRLKMNKTLSKHVDVGVRHLKTHNSLPDFYCLLFDELSSKLRTHEKICDICLNITKQRKKQENTHLCKKGQQMKNIINSLMTLDSKMKILGELVYIDYNDLFLRIIDKTESHIEQCTICNEL